MTQDIVKCETGEDCLVSWCSWQFKEGNWQITVIDWYFISEPSLEYFLAVCLWVVNCFDTLQFHSCATLHCTWTGSLVHVLSWLAALPTGSHLPGWTEMRCQLWFTCNCTLPCLCSSFVPAEDSLRSGSLCLQKGKQQIEKLLAC